MTGCSGEDSGRPAALRNNPMGSAKRGPAARRTCAFLNSMQYGMAVYLSFGCLGGQLSRKKVENTAVFLEGALPSASVTHSAG